MRTGNRRQLACRLCLTLPQLGTGLEDQQAPLISSAPEPRGKRIRAQAGQLAYGGASTGPRQRTALPGPAAASPLPPAAAAGAQAPLASQTAPGATATPGAPSEAGSPASSRCSGAGPTDLSVGRRFGWVALVNGFGRQLEAADLLTCLRGIVCMRHPQRFHLLHAGKPPPPQPVTMVATCVLGTREPAPGPTWSNPFRCSCNWAVSAKMAATWACGRSAHPPHESKLAPRKANRRPAPRSPT